MGEPAKKEEPKRAKKKLADTTSIRKVVKKEEPKKVEPKPEPKKVETPAPVEEKVVAKEEPKKVEAKKEEPKKEEAKPERKVKTALARRTGGIRFVKKKRPNKDVEPTDQPKKQMKSMMSFLD